MPEDVQISGETRDGGGRSWVATCSGHSYVCSQVSTGGFGYGYSSQTSCTPRAGFGSPAPTATVAASVPSPAAQLRDPPVGAGGFRFDMPIKEAQAACESRGRKWQVMEHSVGCDGSLVDLGFPATVALRECDGTICRVDVIVTPPDDAAWAPMFGTILKQLTQKYGEPAAAKGNLPESCQDSFAACVRDGRVSLRYEWAWPHQEGLKLLVGNAKGVAIMQLSYASSAFARQTAPGL